MQQQRPELTTVTHLASHLYVQIADKSLVEGQSWVNPASLDKRCENAIVKNMHFLKRSLVTLKCSAVLHILSAGPL